LIEEGNMEYIKAPQDTERELSLLARKKTEEIIQRVRSEGDTALKDLNRSLDGYSGKLKVSEEEIETALNELDQELKDSLLLAIRNVRKFHRNQKQLFRDQEWKISEEGITAGIRFQPVENAAVYIPGGRYPLPSSAMMGIIPAQEAGVKRIAAVSPPSGSKGINPIILATAGLLGVKEIWNIGGAQAIAALALGTETIDRVDMIVGPGNAFVTEAKRILYGEIGIDGLAGPSEVLIIADGKASPEKLAADLLAQSEHDPLARSTLICTDRRLAVRTEKEVQHYLSVLTTKDIAGASWSMNGSIIFASIDEAVQISNETAPEHLQLDVEEPYDLLKRCNAYGAAFLGRFTSVPFGDYIGGTNHTLPTEGRARFTGGLWTGTFLRPLTHLYLEQDGASYLSPMGTRLASTEGLEAHARSMELRKELLK
jgi:histidinol dehydrogenase/sulfopropanediol 3-dehydrogenase